MTWLFWSSSYSISWEWIIPKPELAPENFESCEPSALLINVCQYLIDEFEAGKLKSKKKTTTGTRKKKIIPANVVTQSLDQKPITQFFAQRKNKVISKSKPKTTGKMIFAVLFISLF